MLHLFQCKMFTFYHVFFVVKSWSTVKLKQKQVKCFMLEQRVKHFTYFYQPALSPICYKPPISLSHTRDHPSTPPTIISVDSTKYQPSSPDFRRERKWVNEPRSGDSNFRQERKWVSGFGIRVIALVKFSSGFWWMREHLLRVYCDQVQIWFGSNNGTGSLMGQTSGL